MYFPAVFKVLAIKYAGARSQRDQYLDLRNAFVHWFSSTGCTSGLEPVLNLMNMETSDPIPFCSTEHVFLLINERPSWYSLDLTEFTVQVQLDDALFALSSLIKELSIESPEYAYAKILFDRALAGIQNKDTLMAYPLYGICSCGIPMRMMRTLGLEDPLVASYDVNGHLKHLKNTISMHHFEGEVKTRVLEALQSKYDARKGDMDRYDPDRASTKLHGDYRHIVRRVMKANLSNLETVRSLKDDSIGLYTTTLSEVCNIDVDGQGKMSWSDVHQIMRESEDAMKKWQRYEGLILRQVRNYGAYIRRFFLLACIFRKIEMCMTTTSSVVVAPKSLAVQAQIRKEHVRFQEQKAEREQMEQEKRQKLIQDAAEKRRVAREKEQAAMQANFAKQNAPSLPPSEKKSRKKKQIQDEPPVDVTDTIVPSNPLPQSSPLNEVETIASALPTVTSKPKSNAKLIKLQKAYPIDSEWIAYHENVPPEIQMQTMTVTDYDTDTTPPAVKLQLSDDTPFMTSEPMKHLVRAVDFARKMKNIAAEWDRTHVRGKKSNDMYGYVTDATTTVGKLLVEQEDDGAKHYYPWELEKERASDARVRIEKKFANEYVAFKPGYENEFDDGDNEFKVIDVFVRDHSVFLRLKQQRSDMILSAKYYKVKSSSKAFLIHMSTDTVHAYIGLQPSDKFIVVDLGDQRRFIPTTDLDFMFTHERVEFEVAKRQVESMYDVGQLVFHGQNLAVVFGITEHLGVLIENVFTEQEHDLTHVSSMELNIIDEKFMREKYNNFFDPFQPSRTRFLEIFFLYSKHVFESDVRSISPLMDAINFEDMHAFAKRLISNFESYFTQQNVILLFDMIRLLIDHYVIDNSVGIGNHMGPTLLFDHFDYLLYISEEYDEQMTDVNNDMFSLVQKCARNEIAVLCPTNMPSLAKLLRKREVWCFLHVETMRQYLVILTDADSANAQTAVDLFTRRMFADTDILDTLFKLKSTNKSEHALIYEFLENLMRIIFLSHPYPQSFAVIVDALGRVNAFERCFDYLQILSKQTPFFTTELRQAFFKDVLDLLLLLHKEPKLMSKNILASSSVGFEILNSFARSGFLRDTTSVPHLLEFYTKLKSMFPRQAYQIQVRGEEPLQNFPKTSEMVQPAVDKHLAKK